MFSKTVTKSSKKIKKCVNETYLPKLKWTKLSKNSKTDAKGNVRKTVQQANSRYVIKSLKKQNDR